MAAILSHHLVVWGLADRVLGQSFLPSVGVDDIVATQVVGDGIGLRASATTGIQFYERHLAVDVIVAVRWHHQSSVLVFHVADESDISVVNPVWDWKTGAFFCFKRKKIYNYLHYVTLSYKYLSHLSIYFHLYHVQFTSQRWAYITAILIYNLIFKLIKQQLFNLLTRKLGDTNMILLTRSKALTCTIKWLYVQIVMPFSNEKKTASIVK